ncbi:MAG TPA: hypothetical protein PKD61_33050 [Polyangiaceae bacterium]|nr:hypothetical protein [Polyangiaceae bacterium]
MRGGLRAFLCLLGVCAQASAQSAQDAPTQTWSPGNPTTSQLEDEVQPGDEGPLTDGVYGRLDGDMTAAVALGAAVGDARSYLAADLSLHYFWTVGIYANLREGLGGDAREFERAGGVGVEVRPLFLPRLLLDMQGRSALLDLTLDSLSFGLGAYFADEARPTASSRGVELSLGLSVPLFRSANGPFIRLRGERRLGSAADESSESLLTMQLAWHGIWASPLSSP